MKKNLKIRIRRKPDALDLALPRYMTHGASGMDLSADVQSETVIKSGEIKLISCGIYISIPEGYEAEVRPRSGLALKHGITLLNSPGTIDSDFRGLVSLIVMNLGKKDFVVKRGERLAQMVIKEVVKADLLEVDSLDRTPRGAGGFGHSGR